jgi:hypothetical protein
VSIETDQLETLRRLRIADLELLARWMVWATTVAFKSDEGEKLVADTDAALARTLAGIWQSGDSISARPLGKMHRLRPLDGSILPDPPESNKTGGPVPWQPVGESRRPDALCLKIGTGPAVAPPVARQEDDPDFGRARREFERGQAERLGDHTFGMTATIVQSGGSGEPCGGCDGRGGFYDYVDVRKSNEKAFTDCRLCGGSGRLR